ncbi:hypothetical protein [Streptomyces sp. NPDC001809]
MAIPFHNQTPHEFQRAAALLTGFLGAAGDGWHVLVAVTAEKENPLRVAVQFHNEGEATALAPGDACEAMMTLIRAASTGGGVVMRTNLADETSQVRGWKLKEFYARPLSAAEISHAYCTDAETGEPIAPEEGVEYLDAPRLKVLGSGGAARPQSVTASQSSMPHRS